MMRPTTTRCWPTPTSHPRSRIHDRQDRRRAGQRSGHTPAEPKWRVGTDPVSPPVVQHDGVVIVSGDALPLLYRCTIAMTIRHHRDGVAPPPLLHALRAALYRATTSPPRHRVAETRPPDMLPAAGTGDLIGVAEADALVAFSSTGGAASQPGCRARRLRLGHAWVLRRAPVLALAARRKAAAK